MNINYTLWPNTDGNLGNKKVQIPDGINTFWPEGDALVGNFVYKDGKLVGFVDIKALTVNDSKSTTFPYDYVNIQLDKSLVKAMSFNKGERTKYFTIASFYFVIIDFNTADRETINIVRTAKRVVDNELYDAEGSLIGIWDSSSLEVGGIFNEGAMKLDGLFCNMTIVGTVRGFTLSEFDSDLSSLRDGSAMFAACNNLTSFSSDLSNLMNGTGMFASCVNLNSFSSDLSSLTDGISMFYDCKLDTASVQNIADTINPNPPENAVLDISIGNSSPNEQETEAFNTIAAKGWIVSVNGSEYTPTSPAAIITLDENGEEISRPIPFYAKPIEVEKSRAKYISEDGKFYRIRGGQFIYGDDLSTYGMFTCEEDAAANMRLTKIEKQLISKFALKH